MAPRVVSPMRKDVGKILGMLTRPRGGGRIFQARLAAQWGRGGLIYGGI